MEDIPNSYKETLERMISFPLKSQIKVDFDLSKKTFSLSVPIFRSPGMFPTSVKDYVEARKEHRFKPHATAFRFDQGTKVLLVQEVPFQWGFQPGLRDQIVAFWKLAKHCHQLLVELAIEEKYHDALHLDLGS